MFYKVGVLRFVILTLIIILGQKSVMGQFGLKYENVVGEQVKNKVRQSGEAFEYVDAVSKNFAMRGTLRILRTEDPNKLNYVPIGKWICNARFPTISGIGKKHSRDTVTYDSLGNILRNVHYIEEGKVFELTYRATSEYKDGFFIETMENLKHNKVKTVFRQRIVDFNVPKAYDYKVMMPIETRK